VFLCICGCRWASVSYGGWARFARSPVPLNNQSPAAALDRSLAAGDSTAPGPPPAPRGITLNRQNSIGAGSGGAGAPGHAADRCRHGLRQGVSPVPAPTPAAVATAASPASGADRRRRPRNVDEKSVRDRVSSSLVCAPTIDRVHIVISCRSSCNLTNGVVGARVSAAVRHYDINHQDQRNYSVIPIVCTP